MLCSLQWEWQSSRKRLPTTPTLFVTRSLYPFLSSLRSMRLSLPFFPLFGVASEVATSKEEVQTHEQGSSLARSLMYSSRAWMFGACSPLYNRTALSVFGSFCWVRRRIGFKTVEERFHRREMASLSSNSTSISLCVPAVSQYFSNFHCLPVQMASRIGPSPKVAMHSAVAPIVAIWYFQLPCCRGILESFCAVLCRDVRGC